MPPRLTRQEKIDAYDKGVVMGATHMLVVWDFFDFEGSYDFIVYCLPGQEVLDCVKENTYPCVYRVSEVYAMHLDIEEQLQEKEPWHIEYPLN